MAEDSPTLIANEIRPEVLGKVESRLRRPSDLLRYFPLKGSQVQEIMPLALRLFT